MNPTGPLHSSVADEHERLGAIVTRIIADFMREIERHPVSPHSTPAELRDLFDEKLPVEGSDVESILGAFRRDVAPNSMCIPSPRYFGLFNPTPLPIAVWADALASALNQNGAVWRNSPAASVMEAHVGRWLCDLVGYGPESHGVLASGGSEANLVALKCARDAAGAAVRDDGLRAAGADMVVYASDQCHYSVEKSVDILGLGRHALRKIATDERFHIRMDDLGREIERDLTAGRVVCCIVGAAGATSTGIVDPLDDLAAAARKYNCWFHVDAAYGGALAFSEDHRGRLSGIEQANSITIDPHKWMFVPFECGAVLVRDGGSVLRDAFDLSPEYLSERRDHLGREDVAYDLFRYGQLGTRRFNALKIWMAFRLLGRRGYAAIIDRQIELTRYFAGRLGELEDFELAGEIETAVCCFRFRPLSARGLGGERCDELQQALQQRIERSGEAWISTTVLHGRRALRVNVNSYLTERRHMDDLVELIRREGAEALKQFAREQGSAPAPA